MDGQMFVTDTMIIDIRNDAFINAGDPFPKDAMHPKTFAKLVRKGEVLEYTEDNRIKLNPRLSRRREVLGIEPQRDNPKGLKELVQIQDPDTDEDKNQSGPRKLVVPVPGQQETPPAAPPTVPPAAAPEALVEPVVEPVVEAPVKAVPANIWTFDPAALQQHEMPVLQQSMVERCQEYKVEVPNIHEKESLIAFMSKDFVQTQG